MLVLGGFIYTFDMTSSSLYEGDIQYDLLVMGNYSHKILIFHTKLKIKSYSFKNKCRGV